MGKAFSQREFCAIMRLKFYEYIAKGWISMKIKHGLIAVLLMLVLFAMPVSAEDNGIYDVSELGVELTLPENYDYVLTRDMSEDDPAFAELGLTKEQLFADDSVYLEALTDDRGAEIILTMMANDWSEMYYDFNTLSEEDLAELAEICLMNDNSEVAMEYSEYGLFDENEQAKFLKAVGSFIGEESSGVTVQYVTVLNGQAYTVTFNFVGDSISEETEAMTEDVVTSLTFDEVKPQDKTESNTVFIVIILVLVVIIGILLAVIRKQKYSVKNLSEELFEDKD